MSSPNTIDDDFDYAMWIPTKTPTGQDVTIRSGVQIGVHVMHAQSPDQSELYFEVTAYPTVVDLDELSARQQTFLQANSSDGRSTAAKIGDVGKFTGLTFDFSGTLQGRWKERRFLFLTTDRRSFRIVHDPTSALNERSLDTLTIKGRLQ